MSGRTQALYNSAPFEESLYALGGRVKEKSVIFPDGYGRIREMMHGGL